MTEIDLQAAARKPISGPVLGVIRKFIDQFERRLDGCVEGKGGVPDHESEGKGNTPPRPAFFLPSSVQPPPLPPPSSITTQKEHLREMVRI